MTRQAGHALLVAGLVGLLLLTTAAEAAQPEYCTNIGFNFFANVSGTDYGSLNQPAVWTRALQRQVGNAWDGHLDNAVIYNTPSTTATLYVNPMHFLTVQSNWVASDCLYSLPGAAPATRRLLQNGQRVTQSAPVTVTYSINGSVPVTAQLVTTAGTQEPVAVIRPAFNGMADGFYCMTIKASIAAGAATVTNPESGSSLAVPLAPMVHTKDVCFQLVSAPPTATVAMKTCGGNVSLLLSDISPLAAPATNQGGWMLTQPVVRFTGQLLTTSNGPASDVAGTAAAVVSSNTFFDKYVQMPAQGDPTVVGGRDGSSGTLQVFVPASQWFTDGWWNISVELSLAGDNALLVPLPGPTPYPTIAQTQGTNMSNKTRYMPVQLLAGRPVGVQAGKKTLYLKQLQLPQSVQAGQPLTIAYQYSGAPGNTTCSLDGVPITNNPTKDGCISPLTVEAADLSKQPMLHITFTDTCGNNRTDMFTLTANGVVTTSKVDDPVGMNGVSDVTVGLGGSPVPGNAGGIAAIGKSAAVLASAAGAAVLLAFL